MTDLTLDEQKLFDFIEQRKVNDAKELIKNGDIRINCIDKTGMNPLDQACFRGEEELVRFLIENGANVDNRAHEQGYTCLMFAALAGNPPICQMLLDAGARPHAVNTINRTASELAAFVGQHECVSVISSYIDSGDIERILHPRGKESDVIYPSEFVTFIHDLTKTHEIHPVKITFEIAQNEHVLEHRKKLLFVIDTLFERQLRSKEPNEPQSIKLWIILHTIRELLKFVDNNSESGKTTKELMLLFAKKLLLMEPEDEVRKNEEALFRAAVRAFPYHNSLLFQTLAKSVAKIEFGKRPACFKMILQALFGPRFAESSKFCSTCGVSSAKKVCPKCKIPYCSPECQKFDWSIHKKCCEAIQQRPQTSSSYIELNEEDLEKMVMKDQEKIEEEEAAQNKEEEITEKEE
uniref:Ankyrin repeat and MYND domain-containing protein 2 n=1 Tax=Panagrolaimus superbus TaxID=310955 RepID=A0A914YD02_9BILA